ANATGDRRGGEPLEHGGGIGAADGEPAHEGHVDESDGLPHALVLVAPTLPPRGSPPPGPSDRAGPRAAEPVRALPAADVPEAAALLDEPRIDRRLVAAARAQQLRARGVGRIHLPEDLGRACLAVPLLALPWREPVDGEPRDVRLRVTCRDPVRHDAPPPAAGEDPDRVHPRADEV